MAVDEAFADLWIWDRVGDRLPWYLAVATNRMPAKYLIARRIPCRLEPSADEEVLWSEHEEATRAFLDLWRAVRSGDVRTSEAPPRDPSLLDLSVALVQRMLRRCRFCRWNCRVDRVDGRKRGTCQLDAVSRVSSYFHHRGEELVFRGVSGSGTVFFTSCCFRCQFCQNGDISRDKDNGTPMSPGQLAAIAWDLRTEGAHNINWVGGEPTIHLHTIIEAIARLARGPPGRMELAHARGTKSDDFIARVRRPELASFEGEFNAPMLWNSNMFMSPETIRLLHPLIDAWLPDFKFGNDGCAILLAKTPWYFETVARNHALLGDWGEDVVIRHLVMPGHVECCTRPVLRWIADHMPGTLVNVMDQYHPDSACDSGSDEYDPRYAAMARRPTDEEIRDAYAAARGLGLRFEDVTFEKSVRRRA